MRPDAEGYWIQAERNLARARGNVANRFFDGATADSLQAAELALKALIVEVTGKPARKTHDLAQLGQVLVVSGRSAPPSVVAAMARLPESVWIEARYPDPGTDTFPPEM